MVNKLPASYSENKWALLLQRLAQQKNDFQSFDQARETIEANNHNSFAVLKNLMKRVTVRGGFFETLHLSLIHISKLTLRALKDLLQPHSLDEADKMANIRPDLLHNLREVLAAKQLKSASQAMISQTTKKFNSTQTKIKS